MFYESELNKFRMRPFVFKLIMDPNLGNFQIDFQQSRIPVQKLHLVRVTALLNTNTVQLVYLTNILTYFCLICARVYYLL